MNITHLVANISWEIFISANLLKRGFKRSKSDFFKKKLEKLLRKTSKKWQNLYFVKCDWVTTGWLLPKLWRSELFIWFISSITWKILGETSMVLKKCLFQQSCKFSRNLRRKKYLRRKLFFFSCQRIRDLHKDKEKLNCIAWFSQGAFVEYLQLHFCFFTIATV